MLFLAKLMLACIHYPNTLVFCQYPKRIYFKNFPALLFLGPHAIDDPFASGSQRKKLWAMAKAFFAYYNIFFAVRMSVPEQGFERTFTLVRRLTRSRRRQRLPLPGNKRNILGHITNLQLFLHV